MNYHCSIHHVTLCEAHKPYCIGRKSCQLGMTERTIELDTPGVHCHLCDGLYLPFGVLTDACSEPFVCERCDAVLVFDIPDGYNAVFVAIMKGAVPAPDGPLANLALCCGYRYRVRAITTPDIAELQLERESVN